mgnify:FL=1
MESLVRPINLAESSSLQEWRALSAPKEPIWVCNTENTVVRMAKNILSVLIFPIGLVRLLHRVVGNIIVPATLFTKMGVSPNEEAFRVFSAGWNIQRVSIQTDGRIVDAAIVTRKDATLVQPHRWTLLSGGNGEFLHDLGNLALVGELQSNGVYYNYPGVMGSTGEPSRSTIAKTSRVMLKFLEERLQAKEIIWYGHSLGGGAQEAFSEHVQKADVKYCLMKSRTFSHLRKVAQDMFGGYRLFSFLVWFFGWDMSPVASVRNTNVPQIILQTDPKIFTNFAFRSDGIITEESSLAKAVVDVVNPKCKKLFVSEMHNDFLTQDTLQRLKNLVKNEGFLMQEAAG